MSEEKFFNLLVRYTFWISYLKQNPIKLVSNPIHIAFIWNTRPISLLFYYYFLNCFLYISNGIDKKKKKIKLEYEQKGWKKGSELEILRERETKRWRSRETENQSEKVRNGRLPFILLGGGGELPEDPGHIVPVNVQAKTWLL